MSVFSEFLKADFKRYGGGKIALYQRLFHYYFRKAQTRNSSFGRFVFKVLFRCHSRLHGIEIPSCTRIGKGFYLCHAYNITVNGGTVIGENCNIHKGVTIGTECRGRRAGTPTIGNCVSICVNATIVGKITIGDDVIIAPNAFVNCDIPSHSIVIGNPCIVKHRENATAGYVCNVV